MIRIIQKENIFFQTSDKWKSKRQEIDIKTDAKKRVRRKRKKKVLKWSRHMIEDNTKRKSVYL